MGVAQLTCEAQCSCGFSWRLDPLAVDRLHSAHRDFNRKGREQATIVRCCRKHDSIPLLSAGLNQQERRRARALPVARTNADQGNP